MGERAAEGTALESASEVLRDLAAGLEADSHVREILEALASEIDRIIVARFVSEPQGA